MNINRIPTEEEVIERYKLGWTTKHMGEYFAKKYNDIEYYMQERSYRILRKYNLKPNKCKTNCRVCGKKIESKSGVIKYCSYICRAKKQIEDRKKRKKYPAIGNRSFKIKFCKNCGKKFRTKSINKVFCNKECRLKYFKKYRKSLPTNTKEVIGDMRFHFNRLKEINPVKAQKIADEMEILEGKEFRDLALNGLAPFINPKKPLTYR